MVNPAPPQLPAQQPTVAPPAASSSQMAQADALRYNANNAQARLRDRLASYGPNSFGGRYMQGGSLAGMGGPTPTGTTTPGARPPITGQTGAGAGGQAGTGTRAPITQDPTGQTAPRGYTDEEVTRNFELILSGPNGGYDPKITEWYTQQLQRSQPQPTLEEWQRSRGG